MARIDYDEDDHDDAAGSPRRDWRRTLLTWVLAAAGLGLGFLVPYMLYLNHQVGERFGQLQWQVPTRVYARPLELVPGVAMDARALRLELEAAGYREGDGQRPGTWASDDGRWTIASRGFTDVGGEVPASRVEVQLAKGTVARMRDLAGGRDAARVRLDPARIATLYGRQQEERRLVRVQEVPQQLTDALQAVEDRDFAHHHGIDVRGIARAAWVNLKAGEARQGASTLTQQLARSGLLGIGREQTWTRKVNEVLYALIIEARYGKGVILEAYLNQVYLGQRGNQAIRGVAAGAEYWFGRQLDDLSTEQVALMVGIIRGPSHYDPRRHPERAKTRRDFVLGEMLETGLIDQATHDRAVAAPLGVTSAPGSIAANRFPAYIDVVRRHLASDYSSDELQGAGLVVMTAMAPSAQAYAESAVTRTLGALDSSKRPALEAGMVLTDVHSGQVVAVVGSRDFAMPGFNRAIEAHRPVGSLLKPFVYLLALALPDRYSLASWVDDSPVTVTLQNGKRWTPGNSDGKSHGSVRLIDALARSYNQATVRVGMAMRPERLAQLIQQLAGIEAVANPALILGSVDQTPYAMAQLYQFLASDGEIQPLYTVRGVLDPEGRVLNRYDKAPRQPEDGDRTAARLVTVALQHAVSSGTGRQLVNDGLGRLDSAGKTGTSNDGRDSWYAGWTGDHLAVVWVGNDRNEQTGLYGATGAMRVWSATFARLPSAPLRVDAKGLEWTWVVAGHSTDAGCAGARRFAFAEGFAPPWQPCVIAPPPAEDASGGGWREWFGFGSGRDPATEPPPQPVTGDPANQPPPPPQDIEP
ncbi:penicillin-binding protein 1B [Luteimonas sp. MC1750]|uniref:penicillin-binding protein 1B n=1 Tax=Luteimonas sp. MC1750 TaxID=2799326 RepID=UPI0018F0ABCE|nr:penicillin-binding protein 1B [Luteimonas sp. MC1750]MBJ6985368.1 penicillin-binding protein 1B [Luteimonas sp. MC1750]QQO05372.1 penicillin-binding protein 1B [Luteimonas sp. MC1750]